MVIMRKVGKGGLWVNTAPRSPASAMCILFMAVTRARGLRKNDVHRMLRVQTPVIGLHSGLHAPPLGRECSSCNLRFTNGYISLAPSLWPHLFGPINFAGP